MSDKQLAVASPAVVSGAEHILYSQTEAQIWVRTYRVSPLLLCRSTRERQRKSSTHIGHYNTFARQITEQG